MERLEALLRCPECGSEIILDELAVCAGGHRYPIVGGIPVFLDETMIASDPQYAAQRAYFDSEFRGYQRYVLENWRLAYLDRLRTADVLEDPASPLVDVGVGGSGYTVIEAARGGRPAIGCDLSLEGLLIAREFARLEGVAERTLWVCCSAEKLPLASASTGSALAIAVLEHVPDDQAALRELARVLQPGGRACVATKRRRSSRRQGQTGSSLSTCSSPGTRSRSSNSPARVSAIASGGGANGETGGAGTCAAGACSSALSSNVPRPRW